MDLSGGSGLSIFLHFLEDFIVVWWICSGLWRIYIIVVLVFSVLFICLIMCFFFSIYKRLRLDKLTGIRKGCLDFCTTAFKKKKMTFSSFSLQTGTKSVPEVFQCFRHPDPRPVIAVVSLVSRCSTVSFYKETREEKKHPLQVQTLE